MTNNCKGQSLLRLVFEDYPFLTEKVILAELVIVAHVQPRPSKGITDLL
jgi:hypothetical protein